MIPDICKILHRRHEYMAVLATQDFFLYITFDREFFNKSTILNILTQFVYLFDA